MRTLRDGYPMGSMRPKEHMSALVGIPSHSGNKDAIGINVIPASTPERRIMRYEPKTTNGASSSRRDESPPPKLLSGCCSPSQCIFKARPERAQRLDFSREESVHADVVGGLERHSANGQSASPSMAGLWVVGVPRMGCGCPTGGHPMAKSHSVDEPRSADAVERTKRQRRPKASHKSIKGKRRNGRRAARVPFCSRGHVKPAPAKTKQQAASTCSTALKERL